MLTEAAEARTTTRKTAATMTTAAALTVGVGVAAGIALAEPAGAAPAASTASTAATASTNGKIDNQSRDSVQAGYQSWFLPTQRIPIGWTGNASTCNPGAPSPTAQAATRSAVNYFRAQAGLSAVSFNPSMSLNAQSAALIMTANNSLSHNPPAWWRCWTPGGASSAARSNLSLGVAGAPGVAAMVADAGASNTAVGHRRWILNPSALTMGAGSTNNALALDSMGATAPSVSRYPVAWPSAGYFPRELEPAKRWSLSIAGADFSAASVSVVGPDGRALTVRRHAPVNGYAQATLAWQVENLVEAKGLPDRTYRVTVSGIRKWWSTSHTYTVTMIDGTKPGQHTPIGDLHDVSVSGRQVTLTGWAYDHNLPAGLLVRLSTGSWSTTVTTSTRIAGLAAFGLPTTSGFTQTVELPPGAHDVCAEAIDHGGNAYTGVTTLLACRQVLVK